MDLTDEGYIAFSVDGKWKGPLYHMGDGFNNNKPVYAAVSVLDN